jgi:hypothetical protein
MTPPSTLRALARRMIEDAECEQAVADAIGRHEGWIMPPDERRRRVAQCLRGHANRHFCADWLPILVRIVVANGGDDVITGLLDQARRDGLREREEVQASVAPTVRRERGRA